MGKSIRAAYVCTDQGVPIFGCKGASVHVQEVISTLLRLGAEVKLFASSVGGERLTGYEDVEIHDLPDWPEGNHSGAQSSVEAANDLLRLSLERSGPFDLIYERYSLWSHAAMEFADSIGVPGVLEVNAPLIEEQLKYRFLADRAGAEEVARRAFGAARRIFAVSGGVANYLARFPMTDGKVHVVHNGVNPARFLSNTKPSRPAKPGILTIGFVGSLKPWHGLNVLTEAYALLRNVTRDTRLLIVGDGPERESLVKGLDARGFA